MREIGHHHAKGHKQIWWRNKDHFCRGWSGDCNENKRAGKWGMQQGRHLVEIQKHEVISANRVWGPKHYRFKFGHGHMNVIILTLKYGHNCDALTWFHIVPPCSSYLVSLQRGITQALSRLLKADVIQPLQQQLNSPPRDFSTVCFQIDRQQRPFCNGKQSEDSCSGFCGSTKLFAIMSSVRTIYFDSETYNQQGNTTLYWRTRIMFCACDCFFVCFLNLFHPVIPGEVSFAGEVGGDWNRPGTRWITSAACWCSSTSHLHFLQQTIHLSSV